MRRQKPYYPNVTEYFVGATAPFYLFESQFHSVFYVVESLKGNRFYTEGNPAAEIGTIGLIAHFEAFCKHQFAALANIYPALLETFCHRRGEPSILVSSILTLDDRIKNGLGFLLAEQYDFGTGKLINGLFRDLVDIPPLTTKEIKTFDAILVKRNLLVHHGGFYTLKQLKQRKKVVIAQTAFKEAVKIDTEDFGSYWDFLFDLAIKITRSTTQALRLKLQKKSLMNEHYTEVIDVLLQAVHDTLDN